ncbi:aldo/keto reductase [Ruegeria sp. HKCCD6228]|uniref:Aldo/keto reductase n=1 Tax=Ruegeria atlantica TaxID=81569 RepID=A0ABX1WCB0_9RHOB|nr:MULTISPECIES: aldo/keto reductase [Ruegeria]NOC93099.1 aldo/keto reductase [Ruegeria sp. HKCCD6604]NOD30889.1 aldo/keto reductase [Ruegeria atlantica]NOD97279.1 aldo/keto reductase [Ruegeria sp. HKCCD6228]NOE27525.1 aldo/keto reductase [Ruegeria sp. HKCCD6157]
MTKHVEIGRTGVRLPQIGFGSTGLGSIPQIYGYEVDEGRALDTIRAILQRPDGFIDTARGYAMGRSEERIGQVIRELGGWPEGRVLSTKLDRDMESNRFDATQARRSLEASLQALGVEQVDILHLHDPEYAADISEVTGTGGALDELFRIKEEGLAKAVGLAGGRIDVLMPMLRDREFDVLLTHNRHTVVNVNSAPMIELARSNGVAVLNAAPYSGGILAKGSSAHHYYVYQQATEAVLGPVRAVESICSRYDVPLGALALQFSVKNADIASTICGATWPQHVDQTFEWANWAIPDAVWSELAELGQSQNDPETG